MTAADRTREGPSFRPRRPRRFPRRSSCSTTTRAGGPPSLLFSEPLDIIAAWTPEEVPAALKRIEEGVACGLHAAGFFAYELGYVLEPKLSALMPEKRNVRCMWIGLYKAPAEMTSAEVEHWLATHTRSGSFHFTDVKLSWDEAQYLERFAEVIEKIRAGDIYQLNLTFKARFKLSGSPLTFFLDLRQKQRVAYGGIVDTGEVTVLSASPELFIEQDGRTVFTRPMKGTAPRAGTQEADAWPQAARRGREAARREPDDRRPDAQRHRAHRRDRQRRRHGPVHRRDLQDAAPDDVRACAPR